MSWDDDEDDGRGWEEIEDVEVVGETDLALRVDVDGSEHWIPRSVISGECELARAGDFGTLIVRRWKARELGIEQ